MENKITPIDDDQLASASGGAYLQVSQWRNFLSQSIIGPLDNLAAGAFGSDKSAIQGYLSTLRATCVPGAAVANPVINMWNGYMSSGRAAIQNSDVRIQLDSLLGSAYQYIITHT